MVASGWLVYCNSCCGALLLLWCFVSSVGILFFDFVFCVVYISLVLVGIAGADCFAAGWCCGTSYAGWIWVVVSGWLSVHSVVWVLMIVLGGCYDC